MKVLLTAINAKYIHSNLAVYSLKAAAKKWAPDVDVEIAEFTINNYIDEIFSQVYRKKPDVLALSCYIWNLSLVEELADLMHKAMPELPIWVGGPEVSYDAAQFLSRNPGVTGVMCGEGEVMFSQLMALYGAENSQFWKKLAAICGLYYRDASGALCVTKPSENLDMDTLPFPYENLNDFTNRIIYYESSRGCPFSCSYCLSSIDKRVRFRSTDLVKKELKLFIDHKIPQVKFVDRTFNCKHERTLELWQFIKENDNGVTNFHFEITADLLNEAELELLSTLRPGLVQLEIGVQTTNKETIKEIDRTMDFEELSQIVKRIAAGGNVHQHLDLIAGLPYEGVESFKKSFDDVYALKPQQLQMGFLKVLKGSKMHRNRQDYGLVYRTKPPYEVMSTHWLDFEQVLYLKGIEEMVEVYYNSNQFMNSLNYLMHFVKRPFELFEMLADYYEKRNLGKAKHSRLERYDILLDFGAEQMWEGFNKDVFKEILLYDLYLRENIKSRPKWARDLNEIKSRVAGFYSDEDMRKLYLDAYDKESYRSVRNVTHVEIFENAIFEAIENGTVTKKECAVLFDYGCRDALNGGCYAKVVCGI